MTGRGESGRRDGDHQTADSAFPRPPKPLRQIQKEHIEKVLGRTGSDLEKAARILAVTPGELRRLMRELGVGDE